MNWSELSAIVVSFILSLGGGGVIVHWMGKILADRYVERLKHEIQQEIESYKTKLKKSEFLFQKEFEATSQFISLRRAFLPNYRFPEMEWDDACVDFAYKFEKIENELERYIATHGAVMSSQVLDLFNSVISKVAHGKFEVAPDDVSQTGSQIAGKVMEELEEIEQLLLKGVWAQSST